MFKKTVITLILIISIISVATFVSASNGFSDVKPTDWFVGNLEFLSDKNIVQGNDKGEFMPNDTVLYNQYLKMVVVALTGKTFDVKTGENWDTPYVNKAFELGLVDSKAKDYNVPINRYEMANIALKGLSVLKEEEAKDFTKYKDAIKDYDKIPAEYTDIVLKAYTKGLITGYPDGTFGGEKTMQRCESVAVIARLLDKTQRILPGEVKPPVEEGKKKPVLKHEKLYEVYEKVPEIILHSGGRYDTINYSEDGVDRIESDLNMDVAKTMFLIQIYKNSPKTLDVAKKIIKVFYPTKYETVYQAVLDAYAKDIIFEKTVEGRFTDVRRGIIKKNLVVIRIHR